MIASIVFRMSILIPIIMSILTLIIYIVIKIIARYAKDKFDREQAQGLLDRTKVSTTRYIHKVTNTNTCSRCIMLDRDNQDFYDRARCFHLDKLVHLHFGCNDFISNKHSDKE